MKKLKTIFLGAISIIGAVIFFFILCMLISIIQESLFSPKEYIMALFKSPADQLIFIYEIVFIYMSFFVFNKNFRKNSIFRNSFFRSHKKNIIIILVTLNIVILYTLIFDITIITKDRIIDYRFFSPQGKNYYYNDITSINAGVCNKKTVFPFAHSKGDFYYIIELKDGIKIDLTEFAGASTDEDPRFIIEKLDKQFVNMGIKKVSSMANFKYCTEHLGKIYTDKIKSILENTKN